MTNPTLKRNPAEGGWWCHECKREFNGHRDAESHIEREHGIPLDRILTDPTTGDIFVTGEKE